MNVKEIVSAIKQTNLKSLLFILLAAVHPRQIYIRENIFLMPMQKNCAPVSTLPMSFIIPLRQV